MSIFTEPKLGFKESSMMVTGVPMNGSKARNDGLAGCCRLQELSLLPRVDGLPMLVYKCCWVETRRVDT